MMHSTDAPAGCLKERHDNALSRRGKAAERFLGNDEPDLEDLITDDVMGRVMARDGVQPDQVRALLNFMRNRVR